MVDHDPRPIDPRELGVNNSTLLRDERGRLRWALPGNTPEQNLLIGIRNAQIIFLEKFPEFSDLYLARSEFQTDRSVRLDAKEYILQRIGKQREFRGVFGNTLVNRNQAPYFNGSDVVVKQHLLRSWDIPFTFRDFKAANEFWRGKTEEEVIRTMQEFWLETFPEFLTHFPIEENGRIKDESLIEAKKYVLARVRRFRGDKDSFLAVFGGSPTTRDIVPFFDGSHITAVKKTFAPWGIEIDVTDFSQARLWKGKTREEALSSFREIFLARFPEFKSFFIEGQFKIKPEKIVEATQFILNNTLPSRVFQSRFRGMISVNSPLKGGSAEILRNAFEPWGIHLKLQDLPIEKNSWVGKAEAEAVDLAFEYFKENFPEFEELLKKYNSGVIAVEQITNLILEKVGTHKKFFRVFHASFQTAVKEHFNGSSITALKRIFSPYLDNWHNKEKPIDVNNLSIDEIESLARIFYLQHHRLTSMSLCKNKQGNLARSINRDYPGGIAELRNKLGIPQPPTKTDRLQSQDETAHLQYKVKPKRDKGSQIHLPIVDRDSQVYTDTEGEDWVAGEWFYKKCGITESFLSRRAKDLGVLKGIGANGHDVFLYKVSAVINTWERYLAKPKVDRNTGIYTDSNQERYASKYWFKLKYHLSDSVATQFCKDAQKIEGRDKIGKEIGLYRISDVETIINKHLAKLVLDEVSGIAIDQEKKEWAATNVLSDEFNLDSKTIKKLLEGVNTKVGIGRNGHDVNLYDLNQAHERLSRLSGLPQVNSENRYIDLEGKSWIPQTVIESEYHLYGNKLRRYLTDISTIAGRVKTGVVGILYNELALKRAIESERSKDVIIDGISSEEADKELKQLVEEI